MFSADGGVETNDLFKLDISVFEQVNLVQLLDTTRQQLLLGRFLFLSNLIIIFEKPLAYDFHLYPIYIWTRCSLKIIF